jgi:hypothetical protein
MVLQLVWSGNGVTTEMTGTILSWMQNRDAEGSVLEILERFAAKQPDFPIEIKTVLQHLIVSHHGELDKGALRHPMMLEAMVLNLMDLLDARLEQAFRLIAYPPLPMPRSRLRVLIDYSFAGLTSSRS